jgi:predicted nucleic acid-binding protein
LRRTGLSADALVYADSSALVKLIIDEPESEALERYVADGPALATSRIALVEVTRATALANPAPEVREETARVLDSCLLVDVSPALLRSAAALASESVRTLDAVHLASALRIEADAIVAYDRRLIAAAAAHGLDVTSPGADTQA